jgi:aspartokinase/homoserine dehydrogenase 1
MPVSEFLDALAQHDDHFDAMRKNAESEGKKLRYMAVLRDGVVTIGLVAVDARHPFYSLSGTDNIILLTTERYHERPMVIRGPGAGAAVTAAGVFADIIRIGHYAR